MRGRLVLLACGLLGCSSGPEDCKFCDFGRAAMGPQIVARFDSIAAIETAAPCGSTADPCGVAWSDWGPVGSSEPMSSVPAIDGGGATELCARRYVCPQPYSPFGGGPLPDGGAIPTAVCGSAWLDLHADRCLATVISTAGERQSFAVTKTTSECRSFRCRRAPGQCYTAEVCAYAFSPASITVAFSPAASYDAGVTDATSSGQ